MYRADSGTNSHVKSIGPMHAANLKAMPEGSDPLTSLDEVAAGDSAAIAGLTCGRYGPSERGAPYVARVRQLVNRSRSYFVAVVGSGGMPAA